MIQEAQFAVMALGMQGLMTDDVRTRGRVC